MGESHKLQTNVRYTHNRFAQRRICDEKYYESSYFARTSMYIVDWIIVRASRVGLGLPSLSVQAEL